MVHSVSPPFQKQGTKILKISKREEPEKNFRVGDTKRGGKIFKNKGGTQLFMPNLGIAVVYTSTFCAPFSGRKTESLIQF